ncbi:MAG: putative membrane protein [Marinoscillum sp.]|jgi:putative membrane protein
MGFLVRLLLAALAVVIVSYLLPGVSIDGFLTAVIVAAVIALLNYTVKPILVVLTIPLTVFTLGLFLLVINSFLIMLADYLISGFTVDSFLWALLFSLLLSITNSLLFNISGEGDRKY